jgi:hypothetical protein
MWNAAEIIWLDGKLVVNATSWQFWNDYAVSLADGRDAQVIVKTGWSGFPAAKLLLDGAEVPPLSRAEARAAARAVEAAPETPRWTWALAAVALASVAVTTEAFFILGPELHPIFARIPILKIPVTIDPSVGPPASLFVGLLAFFACLAAGRGWGRTKTRRFALAAMIAALAWGLSATMVFAFYL